MNEIKNLIIEALYTNEMESFKNLYEFIGFIYYICMYVYWLNMYNFSKTNKITVI